jgi:hypothetical protein
MRLMPSFLLVATTVAGFVPGQLPANDSNSVQLIRGPYVQQGSATNIIVRWRTDLPAASVVRYGPESNQLTLSTAKDVLETEHVLRLPNLTPDTRYFYSIETGDSNLARGESYFFWTAPLRSKPTRIWVLGDSGTRTPDQIAVRDSYYRFTGDRHTDLWLMLGDNAYSQGLDFVYQAAVFNVYPEMLRKSVLWPAIGNHEIVSSDPQGIDFPFLHIFSLPTAGEAGGAPSSTGRYYSYDYGNIHLICLDSETSNRTPGSPMLQWLETDLRQNTNLWCIAYWHSPPYSRGTHSSDLNLEQIQMRQYVVPILENHGADLVLCGHSHCYERSFLLNGHYGTSDTIRPAMLLNRGDGRSDGNGPYFKPNLPLKGTVYIVAGCSGQIDGSGTLDHQAMFNSQSALGSVVLDIDRNTLNARFLRSDGSIGDYFTIVKGDSPDNFIVRSAQVRDGIGTVTWSSLPGHYYGVEFTPDIASPAWIEIAEPSPATSTIGLWSGPIPGAPSKGFFRVSLQVE